MNFLRNTICLKICLQQDVCWPVLTDFQESGENIRLQQPACWPVLTDFQESKIGLQQPACRPLWTDFQEYWLHHPAWWPLWTDFQEYWLPHPAWWPLLTDFQEYWLPHPAWWPLWTDFQVVLQQPACWPLWTDFYLINRKRLGIKAHKNWHTIFRVCVIETLILQYVAWIRRVYLWHCKRALCPFMDWTNIFTLLLKIEINWDYRYQYVLYWNDVKSRLLWKLITTWHVLSIEHVLFICKRHTFAVEHSRS